jgi:hypothetical protein
MKSTQCTPIRREISNNTKSAQEVMWFWTSNNTKNATRGVVVLEICTRQNKTNKQTTFLDRLCLLVTKGHQDLKFLS